MAGESSGNVDIRWVDMDLCYIQPPDDMTIISGVPSGDTCFYSTKVQMNQNFFFSDLQFSLMGISETSGASGTTYWENGFGLFKKYNRLASLFNWAGNDNLEKILVKKCTGEFKGPTPGTIQKDKLHNYYFSNFGEEHLAGSTINLENLASMFSHKDFYPGGGYVHPSFTRLLWDAVFASALDSSSEDLFAPYRLFMFRTLNEQLDWTDTLDDDTLSLKKEVIKSLSIYTSEFFMEFCKKRWGLEYTDEESFCNWFIKRLYFGSWYDLYLILWDMMDGIHYRNTDLKYNPSLHDRYSIPGGYAINGITDAVNIYYADDEKLIGDLKTSILTGMQEGKWASDEVMIGWNVYKELKGFPVADQRFYEAQIVAPYALSGEDLDEESPTGGWTTEDISIPIGVSAVYERYRREQAWPEQATIGHALKPLIETEVQYSSEMNQWNSEHEDIPQNPSVSSFLSSMIKSNFNEDMWQEVPWWVGEYIKNVDLLKFRENDEDVEAPYVASPLMEIKEEAEELYPTPNIIHAKSIGNYRYYPESDGEIYYEYYRWNPRSVVLDLDTFLDPTEEYCNPDPNRFW